MQERRAHRRTRILVIEDDPDTAFVLRALLQGAGYVVLVAGDIAGAQVVLASRHRLHLVLLDLILPDGDGLELCRKVRASWPKLPIVVVTAAWPEQELREAALRTCANRFFSKPFDLDALQATVVQLLASAN